MKFFRAELKDSAIKLASSSDAVFCATGSNFLIEENVSEKRQKQFEAYGKKETDVREVANAYFMASVQGMRRNHRSSTFDENLNSTALLPHTIEANQKIIRLERIDSLFSKDKAFDYQRVNEAFEKNDKDTLQGFVELFEQYGGERPSFVAFKSELEEDLAENNWLELLIDRLGLYHHYTSAPGQTHSFMLMEYLAKEVLEQAKPRNIRQPFALATVLECQDNPAFFPVPQNSPHGFAVDLRARIPQPPCVRELLHIRFRYNASHVCRLGQWTGTAIPDIKECRIRHREHLRVATERMNFGDLSEWL